MTEKKSIYKPRPVSGFPEWLPEVRRVEQQWLDHIRKVFESYGYGSIETPAVEELNVIQAKGGDGGADVDKEVYVIERLHKEEGDKEARLALHFDQTVPLARYVAQHFNELVFPFKRYQMQKVWRGERPQAGRFREFYQCDIDVINPDNLPLHFDAEMPAIIWEILTALPGMEKEEVQLRINNRKILSGVIEVMGISEEKTKTEIFRIIDKREKISDQNFNQELDKILNASQSKTVKDYLSFADQIKELAKISKTEDQIREINDHFGSSKDFNQNKTFNEGIEELITVLRNLTHMPAGRAIADLTIVRGLDYYTGTVYETVFVDNPEYGSICSGGRYDDLAGNYINKHLPGVGISIGFSRLFDRLRQQDKLPIKGVSPTQILIIVDDQNRPEGTEAFEAETQKRLKKSNDTARIFRSRGFNVEVYHAVTKIKKQIEYAKKKEIPYIWFPSIDNQCDKVEIEGKKYDADAATWNFKADKIS